MKTQFEKFTQPRLSQQSEAEDIGQMLEAAIAYLTVVMESIDINILAKEGSFRESC